MILLARGNEVCLQLAIDCMTNAERTYLTIFITGLKFFKGSQILVELLDCIDEPCIQASTCFKTLYLPPRH
jgi:hypothetical protein